MHWIPVTNYSYRWHSLEIAASMLGQSSRKRSFGIWGTCSNRWGKCVPSHQLSKWPAIAQWRYMWNWYQKNVTAPKSCQQWLFATCGTGTEKMLQHPNLFSNGCSPHVGKSWVEVCLSTSFTWHNFSWLFFYPPFCNSWRRPAGESNLINWMTNV